jgi:alpha-tubulin suppressor-like RCC1 family protein
MRAHFLTRFSVALTSALLLAACGSNTTASNIAITITPTSASILAGGAQPFTATVTGSENTAVTWAVSEGASGGTVSASGRYTAPQTTGTFHVVATAAADANQTATATVSVGMAIPAAPAPTYSPDTLTCTVGIACGLAAPANAGGAATSFIVTPALPSGLSLGNTTGAISGTPAGVSAATSYVIVATNAGGSGTATLHITVNDVAPGSIAYPASALVCTLGTACSLGAPGTSGGAVVTYSVTPALPAGLTLDASGGGIVGTPTVLSAATSYTITATNSGGSATATVTITVNDLVPSALTYASSALVCTLSLPCTLAAPTASGGAILAFSVSPSLPAGLSLGGTGAIVGTPTILSPAASYTVTATNSGGSATAALSIAVNDAAPGAPVYLPDTLTCTKGSACSLSAPRLSGGPVVSFSVAPALPAGLSIDATGAIVGTPTILAVTASYSVTETNSGGSASTPITVTVNDVAPTAPVYMPPSLVCTKGVACSLGAPTTTGGAVTGFVAAPALPAGLSIDATGAIAGTPTAITAAASYKITASNSGGIASASVTITVNDVAPSAPTYSASTLVCTKGAACSLAAPGNSGSPIVSFAITPALPAGLLLDTTTGAISGTPSILSAATSYAVKATNSGGSATATLSITVNDVAPGAPVYASSLVCTKGSPCSSAAPTSSGGAVVSFAVTGTLPAGLSINASTGVISGTPSALAAAASFTITATNPGGSASGSLSITVKDLPPTAPVYSSGSLVCIKGSACSLAAPGNGTGGPVVSYAISPALPAGLSITAGTGAIVGTPTIVSAATSYTVTATNSGGTAPANLSITVNDVPPGAPVYASSLVCTKGSACTSPAPTSSGGAVVSYAVTGTLPAGLSINSTTGVVSGTPSVVAAAASFTITATNTGGSATGSLSITVNDVAPSVLTYSKASLTCPVYTSCTLAAPTNQGGAVISYSVSPSMPAGLTLNTSTGAIAGSATAALAATSFIVTATNSGGSTTATLSITITPLAVTSLSAGNNHNCAIVAGGVDCWGDPSIGELGNNNTNGNKIVIPTPVVGLSPGVQSIVSGNYFTCALANGGVKCWGYNPNGELGNNTTATGIVASQVIGLTSGVQAIAAGTAHVCAIVNGGVQCWGQGQLGKLGNNATASSGVPVQVTGLTSGVTAIAAGPNATCAVVNGGAKCWGYGNEGELGNNASVSSATPVQVFGLTAGVQAVAVADTHTCAVVNGGLQCWGANYNGELGTTNTNLRQTTVPVAVAGLTSNVQAVIAGGEYTCVIVNGAEKCMGWNSSGQLGNGTTTDAAAPTQVTGLGSGVTAMFLGGLYDTCAIANGTVQCWGGQGTNSRQLGAGPTTVSLTPVQISGLSVGVQQLAAGPYDSFALVGGGIKGWGHDNTGMLGDGSTSDVSHPVQGPLGSSGVVAVATGFGHTCGLANGGVQCWGNDNLGQLGDGHTTQSTAAVQVSGLTAGVQAISAGSDHSCAIINGGVMCWGQNYAGGLGNNSTVDSPVPVQVSGLTAGVSQISLGAGHSCALVNGGVMCWGDNGQSQLGAAASGQSLVPLQVSGLTQGVQAISMGGAHSCALVNGGVQCWGFNSVGQIGNNGTVNATVPAQVLGLTSGVSVLASGSDAARTCALVNGGVQCWGDATSGGLGNGSTVNARIPVQVTGLLSGVSQLTGGQFHSCANVNGAIQCWGRNGFGQLGNNSVTDSAIPIGGPIF